MKLIFLTLICLLFSTEVTADDSIYRIGVIAPLSGPSSIWGEHIRKGAELAVAGLPPERRGAYRLFFEDDRFDPATAISCYRKLRLTDAIDALLIFGSASGLAVIPLAEQDQVLSAVITNQQKPVVGTRYALRMALDAPKQAKLLAQELKRRGLQKCALVSTSHEAMSAYAEAFKAAVGASGLELVFAEEFNKGESDFRTAIERIVRSNAEAVVNVFLPNSLSSFARQLRQRSAGIPFFGMAPAENENEISAAAGALEGMIFTSLTLSPTFAERYRAAYGEEPQTYSAYGHDFVLLIDDARRKGAGSAPQVAAHLRTIKDFSGAGGVFSSDGAFSFDYGATFRTVRRGTFVELDEKR